MNIEHLVEPKIKDLEKENAMLRKQWNNADGYLLNSALEMAEYGTRTSNPPYVKAIYNTSHIVQRDTGHYKVTILIEKL